jgi:predicted Zn-dependent protease with MMP-like domain
MSLEEFEKLVGAALDSLPKEFLEKLDNVVVTVEDYPTPQQSRKLRLKPWTRLLGLHEGVSLKGRTSIYSSSLPDKITVFRIPILSISHTPEEVQENVRSVVLHEIAHAFGFSEEQVRDAEQRRIND